MMTTRKIRPVSAVFDVPDSLAEVQQQHNRIHAQGVRQAEIDRLAQQQRDPLQHLKDQDAFYLAEAERAREFEMPNPLDGLNRERARIVAQTRAAQRYAGPVPSVLDSTNAPDGTIVSMGEAQYRKTPAGWAQHEEGMIDFGANLAAARAAGQQAWQAQQERLTAQKAAVAKPLEGIDVPNENVVTAKDGRRYRKTAVGWVAA